MHARRHNLGFTLMELIMVLMIIAVLCTLVAPNMRSFAKGRVLPNTASLLASTARWCRTQAIAEGTVYRLNFECDAGGVGLAWWVTKDNGTADDGSGANWVEIEKEEFAQKFVLPDGLTLELPDIAPVEDKYFLSFDAAGHTDPVGTIRVRQEENWVDVICETPLSVYHVLPPGGAK
jgi:prepilin-type N-terminal cleavage/methylation domain-containing protein